MNSKKILAILLVLICVTSARSQLKVTGNSCEDLLKSTPRLKFTDFGGGPFSCSKEGLMATVRAEWTYENPQFSDRYLVSLLDAFQQKGLVHLATQKDYIPYDQEASSVKISLLMEGDLKEILSILNHSAPKELQLLAIRDSKRFLINKMSDAVDEKLKSTQEIVELEILRRVMSASSSAFLSNKLSDLARQLKVELINLHDSASSLGGISKLKGNSNDINQFLKMASPYFVAVKLSGEKNFTRAVNKFQSSEELLQDRSTALLMDQFKKYPGEQSVKIAFAHGIDNLILRKKILSMAENSLLEILKENERDKTLTVKVSFDQLALILLFDDSYSIETLDLDKSH
ncbi:MAG: hypothetical protein KA116_10080 [Proteobacteria bacterium]|nr:hypothetical protein [Pseudomonadota bacterium]